MSEYEDYYFSKLSEIDSDVIEDQNQKSKEIIDQYEKNAEMKEILKKEKILLIKEEKKKFNDEINEINDKISKIEIEKNKKVILKIKYKIDKKKNIQKEINEMNEILDTLSMHKESIEKNIEKKNCEIDKIKSISKYPHGNGIFGFAVEYLEASKEINIEWKDFIYTWTMIGYKKIYPHQAHNYIQYQKDLELSSKIMNNIYKDLRENNKFINEINLFDWIKIISKYVKKNNIELDNKIVFRPPICRSQRKKDYEDDKDLEFHKIKKDDLIDFVESDNDENKEDIDDNDLDEFYSYIDLINQDSDTDDNKSNLSEKEDDKKEELNFDL